MDGCKLPQNLNIEKWGKQYSGKLWWYYYNIQKWRRGFAVVYFIKYSAHFFTLKMMLKYSLHIIHGR
jgi:hypothetical protein